jgi:hypothetical protein
MPSAPQNGSFVSQAEQVLTRLRISARQLIDSSPAPIRRAADLQRALGVDAPLGWQTYRLATATDPFATVLYIPRSGLMNKVLTLAQEQGFGSDAIRATAEAYEQFEVFVKEHAGTRSKFDAMIAAYGRESSGQIQIKHRGAAFRANAHVWGVEARTDYRAAIWHPGSKPGWQHAAFISGQVDLRHLRPTAVMGLRRGFLIRQDGEKSRPANQTTPLEEFCSSPCPQLETIEMGDRFQEILHSNNAGAEPVTFFGHQAFYDSNNGVKQRSWDIRVLASVPSRLLLIDMLVPRGWADPESVRASTHGDLADPRGVYENAGPFAMPARESASYLGTDLDLTYTPDVTRCPDMISAVLAANEWNDTKFDIFRSRVRYPILHSMIMIAVQAHEQA